MADSKDNKDMASDDFADDLDAMLNEVESSLDDQEELIDDEDAIDRLLMDDAFDNEEEEEKEKEKESTAIEDKTIDEEDEFDAFSEDVQSDSKSEALGSESNNTRQQADSDVDEFDVDDLLDSVSTDTETEGDEFAEADDMTSNENIPEQIESEKTEKNKDENNGFSTDTENIEPEPEPEPEDDFLMADFDISADDIESEIAENTVDDDLSPEDIAPEQPSIEEDEFNEKEAQSAPELIEASVVTAQIDSAIEKNKGVIEELRVQINQLWKENESLKEQIVEAATPVENNDSTAEDIESLQKEQRKLKKSIIENEDKVPVITYIAIGIAIVALLVGGGLGIIGYSAQSDVVELSELVTTLEEEIEILTAKDPSKKVKILDNKIGLLTAKDDQINKQLLEVNKFLQTNSLQPVVDDLVKQNDHAQEAIEKLLAKVETLENRNYVTPATKKRIKVVAKVEWVVNLVSFKQEWYAKRKASEFNKKGVPAEVVKVKVRGENWFRLTVKGFKSKYKAAAFAVKVKKTLNLSSVWVTKA